MINDLNDIMGTAHLLEATDGLRDFLTFMINESLDFGDLYGRVRPWWYRDTYADSRTYFQAVVHRMRLRKTNDDRDRDEIIMDGSYIPSDSHPPPRRMWDLYSNRVLPYYVFRGTESLKDDLAQIDERLWMVSHSWVTEEDREDLWTDINGQQWPVPSPRASTLEHVRVELLNMGAEYVWLDVLCLRQKGRESDEPRRLTEWKIDVPTIGFVYQGGPRHRYCIIYLNGLGLPCTTDEEVLKSDRHWFNRVWTVQEAVEGQWLPGGLTARSVTVEATTTEGRDYVWRAVEMRAVAPSLSRLPLYIAKRHCTNEVDRVVVIGYCLRHACKSIPVYHPAMTVEQAWSELLRQFVPTLLTSSFVQSAPDKPFSLFLSCDAFLNRSFSWEDYHFPNVPEMLTLMDHQDSISNCPSVPASRTQGSYCHLVATVGPYYLAKDAGHSNERCGDTSFTLRCDGCSMPLNLDTYLVTGVLLPDVPYTLANIRYSWRALERSAWVVIEALETDQTLHGFPVIRAIKWAIIECALKFNTPDPLAVSGSRTVYVAYMDENEARRRTSFKERYIAAFEEMRASASTRKSRYKFGDSIWARDLMLNSLERDWGTSGSEQVRQVARRTNFFIRLSLSFLVPLAITLSWMP